MKNLFSPKKIIILLCIFFYIMVLQSGWAAINKGQHGRDFATYYYANKISQNGENPYHTPHLSRQSKQEKTRKSVHPFFYPPPSLFFFSWTSIFSLFTSYQIFFVMSQICFGMILWLSRNWFGISWLYLLVLACTFTPVQNTMVMGQVNVLVVLMLLYALQYHSGIALACAGMIKMSPVYIMFQWVIEHRWRATTVTIITAIVLSVVSLLFMGFTTQILFYTDILPSFSSGNYNGLRVPITLPANHSIPDIWNQLFPGPNNKTLSVTAKQGSGIVSISLLVCLLFCTAFWKGEQSTKFLSGAFIVLFIITPVYTYEHHLAFAIIPLLFFMEGFSRGDIEDQIVKYIVAVVYVFLAWPLWMLRSLQNENEIWNWLLQESKFFALFILLFLCLYVAYRNQKVHSVNSSH